MDLIALGRFVLLPEDDLTLAIVLKGPLVGLSEEELFTLAQPRGDSSLWQALKQRAVELGAFAEAARYLDELLRLADFIPPFEFFTHVLGALRGRRRLLARLGPEADEPIAEFLELALQYQRTHPPSLEGFLRWLERGDVEIKRDLEQAERNAVRIMTVHGAKGLQAPIVILPDSMQVSPVDGSGRPASILWTPADPPVDRIPRWAPTVSHLDPAAANERACAMESQSAEYRRLLYVAMTRAEDRLYVCGWRRKQKAKGCWYDLIRDGLLAGGDSIGLEQVTDAFLAEAIRRGEFDGDATVLRLCCPQTVPRWLEESVVQPPIAEAPPWVFTPPRAEPASPRPLAPSHDESPGRVHRGRGGPGAARADALRRGQIIHRLLQSLPAAPTEKRETHAKRWLQRFAADMAAEARDTILKEVLAVIGDARFGAIFGEDSLPEVELVGTVGERLIVGRVDRLVVTPAEVVIIDYKTDPAPPQRPRDVPPRYLRQMSGYRRVLQNVYPSRVVRCLLLWTRIPGLMCLDDEQLDRSAP